MRSRYRTLASGEKFVVEIVASDLQELGGTRVELVFCDLVPEICARQTGLGAVE
jgi:hypothetical protein